MDKLLRNLKRAVYPFRRTSSREFGNNTDCSFHASNFQSSTNPFLTRVTDFAELEGLLAVYLQTFTVDRKVIPRMGEAKSSSSRKVLSVTKCSNLLGP